MMKFHDRSLVACAAIAGLLFTAAPAANAAPVLEAPRQNTASLAHIDPIQGSVADQVKNAGSLEEAIGVLESNGFQEIPGARADGDELRFEKTTTDITVGFNLPASNGIQPLWAGGWNWGKGGPYVKATVNQWKDATNSAGIVGGAACSLITAAIGAAGCAAAVGLAFYHINKHDLSKWPKNICVAVSGSRKVWFENC